MEIRDQRGLIAVTGAAELRVAQSDVEILSIEAVPTIYVAGTSHVFTSFIGYAPAELIVHDNEAKVWEVKRCSAKYHHHGECEAITPGNAARFFCDFYELPVKDGSCELLKRTDTRYRDYYSGEYDYSPGRTVTATDWAPIERIVCGNALHLCARMSQSKQWHKEGRLLRCRVALEDMCIFPYNICQVRCRQVYVVEELEEDRGPAVPGTASGRLVAGSKWTQCAGCHLEFRADGSMVPPGWRCASCREKAEAAGGGREGM